MRIGKNFKIGFLAFVIVSVMYPYALCQENEERQFADGTYEASNDMLDVEVSIEKGKISDIKILEHRGSEEYGEMMQPLIDAIIQKQSTKVDGITGATVSSNALKEAIEEALEKAVIGPSEE